MTAVAPPEIDFEALMPRVVEQLFEGKPKKRGDELRYGTQGSMSIDLGKAYFFDHENKVGGGVLDLIQHQLKCDLAGALTWLEDKNLKERSEPKEVWQLGSRPQRIFYDYTNASGAVRYRIERKPNKTFPHHGPDGRGGFHNREGCMDGVQRLPYLLHKWVNEPLRKVIFITEGEKDADNLSRLGLLATTNSGGANSFQHEIVPYFQGRRVVVLADNDEAGQKHVADVVSKLRGTAAALTILNLPDLPDKGDVSDWLAKGGTRSQLESLARDALANPLLEPKPIIDPPVTLESLPLPVELFDDIKPALQNRHLVKGLLLASTKIVIFGQEGSAKSFLLLDILLHIAAGRPWFGRKVLQGGVIYIVAEGASGARGRVEAWKREKGIASGLPFAIIPTAVDLLDPDADLAKLHQVVRFLTNLWGAPPVIIAIDTLSQTIGGGDENTSDMAAYISNCTALSEPYDCATAIVHHQPLEASTKRPRGHSSLAGAMDTMLHVEGRDNPRRVTTVKQKDLERGVDFMFNLKPVEIGADEERQPVSSCVVEQVEGEAPVKVSGRKLSATNKTALDALDRVTIRQGFYPPTTIPSGVIGRLTGKVVELSAWQDEVLAAFADPDKNADTPARLFRRARKELQAAQILGVHGDYVWRNHT